MIQICRSFAIVVPLIMVAGCSSTPAPDQVSDVSVAQDNLGGDETNAAEEVGVTYINPIDRAPAPLFAGLDLGLKPLSLVDFAGEITVVNAWASWCPPCIAETPELIATANSLQAQGVRFLGLNVNDDLELAKAFSAEVPYPSIADPEGRLLALVPGIPPNGLPSTLIIDRQGRIATRIIGPITQEVLTALILEVANEEN